MGSRGMVGLGSTVGLGATSAWGWVVVGASVGEVWVGSTAWVSPVGWVGGAGGGVPVGVQLVRMRVKRRGNDKIKNNFFTNAFLKKSLESRL
jgi:hypothetical protein